MPNLWLKKKLRSCSVLELLIVCCANHQYPGLLRWLAGKSENVIGGGAVALVFLNRHLSGLKYLSNAGTVSLLALHVIESIFRGFVNERTIQALAPHNPTVSNPQSSTFHFATKALKYHLACSSCSNMALHTILVHLNTVEEGQPEPSGHLYIWFHTHLVEHVMVESSSDLCLSHS